MTAQKLDCGHYPTPQRPGSLSSGVAWFAGESRCLGCAAGWVVARIHAGEPTTVYLSTNTGDAETHVTTWDGQYLGHVVRWGNRHPWSHERRYFRARLCDGRLWFGTGAPGEYCNLRRCKS